MELVARLHPPELKTNVATALDMKGSWKKHPDLVYLVAREAAKAWATVEQADKQADKLRRVQSRAKGAACPSGQCQGGKNSWSKGGGQGSSAHSGDSKSRGSC